MGKVVVDLTVSLDGYIAGKDDGPGLLLGRGGERLFTWMSAGPESNRLEHRLAPPDASTVIVDEWMTESGAIISGRRTFDIANGWKDGHPVDVPIFVVTHEAPTHGQWSPRVSFVTDGIERAVELAQSAAGDGNVGVSGADIAQQLLRAGKVDEIQVSGGTSFARGRGPALRASRPRSDRTGADQSHRVGWRHPSAIPSFTRVTGILRSRRQVPSVI